MQWLLVAVGVAVPLIRIYATWLDGWKPVASWRAADWVDFASDAAIVSAAWTGVVLIRRGYFARAVWMFVGVLLASAAAAYAETGYRLSPPDPLPILIMAAGGIVLGRRALWVSYSSLVGIFALGQLADATWLGGPQHGQWAAFRTLPMLALAYGVVALILDRAIAALRTALRQAEERAHALAEGNRRLEREMEERARTQSQLIHSQKMDAVGRLASGVAHDFDNVLNVVLGYAAQREELADRGTPALLTALEGIELAALRALSISRKLLNFSRHDAEELHVFDADEALGELEPMLHQLLGRYAKLHIARPRHAIPLRLNRGQFELMILNIAANARDAMPDGGSFDVRLSVDEDRNEVTLRLSDNGVGMTDAIRQKMFEPFYTTKPTGSGTGLGLSIVASMIEAAGGSVEVISAPGEGTEFVLRLPRAPTAH
ncbi:HAMP domain-containing sensor histidine kinase [Luteibacter sp. OK325]|uniref:sensor histidine kinase n=1 Tax=Luteibacter sp. OK325 TaxID=2135670 RepID=UPI001304C559|nr:HAMP domain-containing sensor histidine kinase [Luteibacter sp. OK325]